MRGGGVVCVCLLFFFFFLGGGCGLFSSVICGVWIASPERLMQHCLISVFSKASKRAKCVLFHGPQRRRVKNCCVCQQFTGFVAPSLFFIGLTFFCCCLFFCRNSWRCTGHGLWHFHQDCTEMPASLCAGASWGGHALYRGDPQWHQHHHLWSTATAGRKGLGYLKGTSKALWVLLIAVVWFVESQHLKVIKTQPWALPFWASLLCCEHNQHLRQKCMLWALLLFALHRWTINLYSCTLRSSNLKLKIVLLLRKSELLYSIRSENVT